MQAPPKFSSFKPKTASSATAVPPKATSTKAEQEKEHKDNAYKRREERHSSSHHSRHRSRHHSEHARHDGQSPPRKQHRRHVPASEALAHEHYDTTYDEPSDLFVVDRRGDLNNLKYGYNEKYKVPIYKEASLRKLLGDRRAYEHERGTRRSLLASLSPAEKRDLRREVSKTSVFAGKETALDQASDFIALAHGKKRKRMPTAASSRYLENKAISSTDDEDTSDSSESSSEVSAEQSTEEPNAMLKEERIRLTRLVKDEPANVEAWLEYIHFQDTWAHQGHDVDVFELPHEEKRSVAEIRLSIYQKALGSISTTNPGREQLLIGMMENAELVLDTAKLEAKWKQVVAGNPSYLLLGQKFLKYSQTDATHFNYNTCRDRCIEHLNVLVKEGINDIRAVHAILHVTTFIAQAGYQEHAIAIWQALFELHCFNSAERFGTGDWQARLDEFEQFWDSEEPRCGEAQDLDSKSAETGPQIQGEPIPFTKAGDWLKRENMTMKKTVLPGRLTDEDGTEDIFHVILFQDIRPFLVPLSYDRFPHALVNALLRFMQLPPIAGQFSKEFLTDQFLRFEQRGSRTNQLASHPKDNAATLSGCAMPCFQTTTQVLFAPDGCFAEQYRYKADDIQTRNFVRSMLKDLVRRYPDWTDLAEYYLAYILCTEPSLARKEARSMIKSSPTNLRLYNAYGLVEMRQTQLAKGVAAIQAAINMSASFSEGSRSDLIYLWHTLIWEAVSTGKYNEALEHCLSIANNGAVQDKPATDIANAESYFNTGRQQALELSRYDQAALHSTCLCLLYYLSSSRNVNTAIEAFATQTAILSSYGPSAEPAIEALHQSQAALIDHHIYHAPSSLYVPANVRAALQSSIASFPTNTMFLSLYAKTEARHRIDDRVRQITRDILSQPAGHHHHNNNEASNLIINVFTIETELQRAASATSGTTRHAVRASFERALAQRQCRHNGSIWSMYLDYELSLLDQVKLNSSKSARKETEECIQRIKGVVFRGLKCLPWVKAWYLRGIEVLVRLGEEQEAQALIKMMVERGLRVSCELEGY